ncbi:hydantoinase B/oxoprolinase family protein [Nesterenkonia alba]|uniref:hydantoinase B/oxoprolinase family protein n=1 Tax=Nesterenkonia alba TaxID=515814 RepID=UPI001FDEDB79|nr:hydantoinase B/oxoprolinase family protein [Nesterenkonia alba]
MTRDNVVADAPGIAVFTRGNDYGVKKSVEFLGKDAMRPGDVFILNYPYWSSAHTLDPLVFAPVHAKDELIGFASCRIHVMDLKQKNPGYVLDSTDAYQEGIVFPASRLYAEGKPNDDVLNLIRFNSRLPKHTIGDIQAQVSACMTGVKRMQEVAEKYGTEQLIQAMADINEHGERLARLALQKLPKGTWYAEDFMDSDGIDLDKPVKMACEVTITDDEMIVDWSPSDRDVPGPINLPPGQTEAVSSLIFKSITTPDSPVVAGNFAPMRVVTEEGSVMHAVHPMPTFTLWTGLLAGEVILKALAQGMPDRIPASSGGDVSSMMGLGTNPRTGEPWVEATNEAVGFGGHAGGDGEDGIMHLSEPGCRNNPVEVLEQKAPLFIESYGYAPDTAGAGKHRGGVGVARHYRFEADSTGICLVYKTKSRPYGLQGGADAEPAKIVLDQDTPDERITGGGTYPRPAGTTLNNVTGGGGGYGDPLERDPALVREDVIDGFISISNAAKAYGVIITDDLLVDEEATASARDELRDASTVSE